MLQGTKAKYEEKLAELRRAHAAELAGMQLQLDQVANVERQRRDEGSRVHEELLEVRGELAKTRSEHESMYHQQLIPSQVCNHPPPTPSPLHSE